MVSLGAAAGPTFIHVNNGAVVNLDAAGLGTATNVITLAGGSFINFATASTGYVFIDNISLADVETMIGQGKFGIDRLRNTNKASYILAVQGAGILIKAGTPAIIDPVLVIEGLNGGILGSTGKNPVPGVTYVLMRGTDLMSFLIEVDSIEAGGTTAAFFDDFSTPVVGGKACYRLEQQ